MHVREMLSRLGQESSTKPYLTFQAAIERNILRLDGFEDDQTRYPGVDIANGLIPNARQAGITRHRGRIFAYDHASVDVRGEELQISPASKNDVTKEGHITNEGIIIQSTEEGRLRVAAFVLDTVKKPWIHEEIRRSHAVSRVGNLAVVSASTMDLPEYEVSMIEAETGILYARPRKTQR